MKYRALGFWFRGVELQTFKEFLLAKRVIPENRVPYYVNWISRFQEFAKIESGEGFTEAHVHAFLKAMEKNHEEWQVKQA